MIDPAANAPAAGVVLDHVGLFVPEMARAARVMERLGFDLTPYTAQRHALASGETAPTGTANRLAVLRQGYIEILTPVGDTPLASQMRRALDRYTGLHLIAFGTADAEAAHERLGRAGFDPLPLVRLQRSVPTAAGEKLARFSVVRVPPDRMPEGRIQFCRHHTPELVWQPERQHHPNRAQCLTDIVLCTDDPQAAQRFGRFLALAPETLGFKLFRLARGRLHVVHPAAFAEATGIEPPTSPFIAGFALTSADLAATRAVLREREVAFSEPAPGVIAARAPEDIATTIWFTEAGATLPWLPA